MPVCYQKAWQESGRVQIFDMRTDCAILVGSRDALVEKHAFSVRQDGVWNDNLERQFAGMEGLAIPHVRRFISGADDSDAQHGVKLLLATCFARGQSIAASQRRIASESMDEIVAEVASTDRARHQFRREFGREPALGELHQIASDVWSNQQSANTPAASGAVRAHNFAVDRFWDLHLQRLSAPFSRSGRFGFLSSDTPVAHGSDKDGWRVGVKQGVALGDAGFVLFPLSPNLAVCVNETALPPVECTVADVQVINSNFTSRNADRFLLGSPSLDIHRCLGRNAPASVP